MAVSSPPLRTSVTLNPRVAGRIRKLARAERTSMSKVLTDLIERGLESRDDEKRRFFDLTDRLASSDDPTEQAKLKQELAKMTYGE